MLHQDSHHALHDDRTAGTDAASTLVRAAASSGAAPAGDPGVVPRPAPEFGPEHASAPYAEALQRFAASSPRSFMVPGHGNDPEHGGAHLAELFGERVPELDVPLMLPGIDLGEDSPLVAAQRLAADAWGAKRSWFLTNGASQANRTAAIAVRGLGERIMIQRSMHSSLTDGVLLAGLIPSFVSPNVDEHHGIAHGLTPRHLMPRSLARPRPATQSTACLSSRRVTSDPPRTSPASPVSRTTTVPQSSSTVPGVHTLVSTRACRSRRCGLARIS